MLIFQELIELIELVFYLIILTKHFELFYQNFNNYRLGLTIIIKLFRVKNYFILNSLLVKILNE